ncbi:MAG: cysteine--tRNA ligase [Patescibacteria group bacterium]
MDIYLTNSLTRKKEKFVALNPPKVGMYTCGPTVYGYQHIGNFRTMTLSDILRRVLVFNGYKVKSIRNITDIDDKTIKGAHDLGVSLGEFTKEYTNIFFDDLEKLNILPVDKDTKATDFIKDMIGYINDLIDKGLAYAELDGSVYFDISSFKNYGKLSRIEKRSLKTGTRVLSDEYTKNNVQDFALWKAVEPNEVGYDSPWGRGRPGWHIECSVMSQKNLGDTFDIHVGGVDLLFPHHENEIAQSEGKTGKKFVNYFIHGEFLLVDGKKMSKSLGNLYTVSDIEKKGFDPLALRYLFLTAHYRDNLNFTWEALEASQTALNKLRDHVVNLKSSNRTVLSEEKNQKTQKFSSVFSKAVNDDLNTPKALAVLWAGVKSNIPSGDKYDLLISFDEVLGLGLEKVESGKLKVEKEIKDLINMREKLRKDGKYDQADKIRRELEKSGYKIEDTDKGAKVKVKK